MMILCDKIFHVANKNLEQGGTYMPLSLLEQERQSIQDLLNLGVDKQ